MNLNRFQLNSHCEYWSVLLLLIGKVHNSDQAEQLTAVQLLVSQVSVSADGGSSGLCFLRRIIDRLDRPLGDTHIYYPALLQLLSLTLIDAHSGQGNES